MKFIILEVSSDPIDNKFKFIEGDINDLDVCHDACKNIVNIQKVQNGYVRPVIWRGSEMMAISAQKNKIYQKICFKFRKIKSIKFCLQISE